MGRGGLSGKLDKMLEITCAVVQSLPVYFILQKPELSFDSYSSDVALLLNFL